MSQAVQPGMRDRERVAMKRVITEHGFEHAVESLATAVAVEVTSLTPTKDYEHRLHWLSELAEKAVLDALVQVARTQGWRATG